MIPPERKVFVAVPKVELKWIGTVSSSIFGPATENTPQVNPKKYLPIIIVTGWRYIVRDTAIAPSKLKIIKAFLLPF